MLATAVAYNLYTVNHLSDVSNVHEDFWELLEASRVTRHARQRCTVQVEMRMQRIKERVYQFFATASHQKSTATNKHHFSLVAKPSLYSTSCRVGTLYLNPIREQFHLLSHIFCHLRRGDFVVVARLFLGTVACVSNLHLTWSVR